MADQTQKPIDGEERYYQQELVRNEQLDKMAVNMKLGMHGDSGDADPDDNLDDTEELDSINDESDSD